MARSATASAASGAGTATRPVVSLLAHATKPTDLLPHLHQYAIDMTGGDCSLLFLHNPRNGMLQPSSGFGLDALRTDPWVPDPVEAAQPLDIDVQQLAHMVALVADRRRRRLERA